MSINNILSDLGVVGGGSGKAKPQAATGSVTAAVNTTQGEIYTLVDGKLRTAGTDLSKGISVAQADGVTANTAVRSGYYNGSNTQMTAVPGLPGFFVMAYGYNASVSYDVSLNSGLRFELVQVTDAGIITHTTLDCPNPTAQSSNKVVVSMTTPITMEDYTPGMTTVRGALFAVYSFANPPYNQRILCGVSFSVNLANKTLSVLQNSYYQAYGGAQIWPGAGNYCTGVSSQAILKYPGRNTSAGIYGLFVFTIQYYDGASFSGASYSGVCAVQPFQAAITARSYFNIASTHSSSSWSFPAGLNGHPHGHTFISNSNETGYVFLAPTATNQYSVCHVSSLAPTTESITVLSTSIVPTTADGNIMIRRLGNIGSTTYIVVYRSAATLKAKAFQVTAGTLGTVGAEVTLSNNSRASLLNHAPSGCAAALGGFHASEMAIPISIGQDTAYSFSRGATVYLNIIISITGTTITVLGAHPVHSDDKGTLVGSGAFSVSGRSVWAGYDIRPSSGLASYYGAVPPSDPSILFDEIDTFDTKGIPTIPSVDCIATNTVTAGQSCGFTVITDGTEITSSQTLTVGCHYARVAGSFVQSDLGKYVAISTNKVRYTE